ncbi:hypothetical protein CAOG_05950 [Capsaspora owczarzaki ATCC 30864]|uniref:CBS domain-containing protein n=1 Tax=Capsaspora owczarzaki (strain ATCC 30864) TaxID=595528 RepID=A0A0D2VVI9_CAPO3|nr:hypothetical protein CAOG_05950 [Capsaspora owczarzaki ATCC 30864]KJE95502.1 hypothetical protein CAOG_005950 [Capsaspora owczarzaki ATCC 30864]|eukprot:XP_004345540.1 hypothetical protein CAOG_05950 [Capsaspora owczarzaki ATCC 30864]
MASFGTASVDDLPPMHNVVTLNSSDTLQAATHTLIKNRVLSAPVWDAATHSFLRTSSSDLFDVLCAIVTHVKEADLNVGNYASLVDDHELLSKSSIKDLIDFAARNPFCTVAKGTLLNDIMPLLAGVQSNAWVRRVIVQDGPSDTAPSRSQIAAIVSQNKLIEYASRHKKAWADMKSTTVQTAFLGAAFTTPITVSSDARVYDAFKLLRDHNISGIAVVDHSGRVIGSLSSRDVKGLEDETNLQLDLTRLMAPVRSFIAYISQLTITDAEKHPAISVRPEDTFERVVDMFASSKVHRLFIIDSNSHAIGVISRVDLLRYLATGEVKA